MSNPLIRAIRGPIMLIALGSLLALDQFGTYSFWRTWPALVILIGLMKLLERVLVSAPSPEGGPQS
ncbi:MAG: hypothetical protein FJW20_13220 [Acidimicrobiia bacterium]|nr:hypothetical protein [Acidimicrobiia bacterium]